MSVHQLIIQSSSLITWSSPTIKSCHRNLLRRAAKAPESRRSSNQCHPYKRSNKALETLHEELISARLARLEGDPRAYKGAIWSENRFVRAPTSVSGGGSESSCLARLRERAAAAASGLLSPSAAAAPPAAGAPSAAAGRCGSISHAHCASR